MCNRNILLLPATAQHLDLAGSGAAAVRTPTSSPAKTWRNRDCPAPSCCPAEAGLALRNQAEGKQRRRDTGQPRPADTRTLPPLIRLSSCGRARVRRSAQTSARHCRPITMRLVHPHPAAAAAKPPKRPSDAQAWLQAGRQTAGVISAKPRTKPGCWWEMPGPRFTHQA